MTTNRNQFQTISQDTIIGAEQEAPNTPQVETLGGWLNPVEDIKKTVEVSISKRFIDEVTKQPKKFIIQTLTVEEIDAIRIEAVKFANINAVNKKKTTTGKLNAKESKIFQGLLIVESCIEPQFRHPAMAQAYGTMLAHEIPDKFFTPGELQALMHEIQIANGLIDNEENDLYEEAKN